MRRKILICGLPGAGKTTLARLLAARLNAVHFNADDVRANISRDLGFALQDRIEQARRMSWLCDKVVEAGGYAIADFICPTEETRAAFGQCFIIWVDRIHTSEYEDTNEMFQPPVYGLRVTEDGTPEYWCERAAEMLRPLFEWRKPTALFVGRYQPFHDGHKQLIAHGIERVGQACIAVRDTFGSDEKNPFGFEYVRARIEHGLLEFRGRFVVVAVPNITAVLYGRDVGYSIERVDLGAEAEEISATVERRKMAGR